MKILALTWSAVAAALGLYFFLNPEIEQRARRDIALIACHEANDKNCDHVKSAP